MSQQVRFGEREDVALWRVQGQLTEAEVVQLGEQIAALLDMTIEDSLRNAFPNKQGKGGHGVQIYWCWTESFLVITTWPQLGFIRVYAASCKEFLPVMVTKFLEARVGPVLKFDYMPI